uniref:Uncharacterized protein n=1 Tax=Romanomermis culicivorax TaxID=13658 RepID=A0A915JD47_ROMCU
MSDWRIIYQTTTFLAFLALCRAGNKCAVAVGHLNCTSDPIWTKDVDVTLWDDDGIEILDDRMGVTKSDQNGNFKVEGCGYDFGSDPDPYVKIFTYCNAPQGKSIKTQIVRKFVPDQIEFGDINLDGDGSSSSNWLHIPSIDLPKSILGSDDNPIATTATTSNGQN